jgi:hypothetical protein
MRNFPSVLTKKLFSNFFYGGGAMLLTISEINYIKQCTDRNYVHKHAYMGSD